ncbi:MAG: hypothetical protein V3T05_07780 [Myxococcota bacterium]
MRPTFRGDLTCSREEQQGVVFYRIDDPKSQTSFRLYEIEYLIATKLDGSRALPEVISAVKGEFNFDISEPDLQRFVNQLESMGFLHGARGEGSSQAPEQDAETQVLDQKRPPVQDIEIEDPDALGTDELDHAEFDRLLRSAFMHVKQGYVVHARDYFLAAKELSPDDERLTKLANHLEIIGDASGPAEVEYLWNQARELFPDLAEEIGPLDIKSRGPDGSFTAPGFDPDDGGEDLRSRIVWFALLLGVLAAGVGGLYWVIKAGHIFESAARVKVVTLHADRLPVYFEESPSTVKPAQEAWLKLGAEGIVDAVRVKPGSRVEAGEIVVTLGLPATQKKKLAKAQKALKQAAAAHKKAADRLSNLLAEREALEAEKASAEDKLKELRPKSVLNQGGVSKRDLERWKQAKLAANKKLSKLAKKSRKPQAQEKKARKKREIAERRVRAIEKNLGPRLLRAPFGGEIVEVKLKAGDKAAAGAPAVLLRDASSVELVFHLAGVVSLQAGGEAYVTVGRGKPGPAKVGNVDAQGEETVVGVRVADPSGAFIEMQPSEFRLVREHVDPAFSVPISAIVEDETGARVYEAVDNKALVRWVEVLQRDAANAIIRDPSGALQGSKQIIISHMDADGDVASIVEGAPLVIEGQ